MIYFKFFNNLPQRVQDEVMTLMFADRYATNRTVFFDAGYEAAIKWIKTAEIERMLRSDNDGYTRTYEFFQAMAGDEDGYDIPETLLEQELCFEVAEALGFHKSDPPATHENIEFEHGFVHAVSCAVMHIDAIVA